MNYRTLWCTFTSNDNLSKSNNLTIPGVRFMVVFITTVFHTLEQIDRECLISINWATTLQKSRKGKHIFGRIIEKCGPGEIIFGQKSADGLGYCSLLVVDSPVARISLIMTSFPIEIINISVVTLQNYLAVTLKTYNATNAPGKESLNPFGLRIVTVFFFLSVMLVSTSMLPSCS